jgi:tetratricopeptide (TPR) repeat protein
MYAEAYRNRGLAYNNKGENEQAILDCNKAVEIDPGDAVAYITRGLAYAQKGEYDKAWEDIRNAESLGLQIPPALLNALRKASGRQR